MATTTDTRIVQSRHGHWLVYAIEHDGEIAMERLIGQVTRNRLNKYGAHPASIDVDVPFAVMFGGSVELFDGLGAAARALIDLLPSTT